MATVCYHCHEPIRSDLGSYQVVINEQPEPMCCPGCAAVASAIVEAGLSDYYRYRTEPANQQKIPTELTHLSAYDLPEVQQEFVGGDEQYKEVLLSLEGISCSACAWLIERHIRALPGIIAIEVNSTTARALLKWQSSAISLSAILAEINQIGYQAAPFQVDKQEQHNREQSRTLLLRVGLAGLATMQVMMVAVALYAGYFYQLELHYRDFLRWISLLFATPVVMYSAQPFYFSALRSLFSRRINMDVPVSLAILLAYGASAKATVTGSGEVYFESVSMFTFFLLLGRLAEQRARRKASEYNSNRQKLIPMTANLSSAGSIQQVAARSLIPDQRILVRPGEAIPADGRIVAGQSDINESMLTGESNPNLKTVGAIVYAGTINVSQPIEVQVTHTGAQMRVHALLRLQEQAASSKPEIAQLADQIAHYFVPVLLMVAGLTYLGWHWWQPEHAFWVTLSVLVASCPCALALATPAALTCGIAKMNKQGLLVRHARALTALPNLTTLLFDKTGTLTNGQFCLQETQLLAPEWSITQVQALAAALERHSAHPYAQAFAPFADHNVVSHQNQHHSGQGISGTIEGRRFRLGSATFVGATNSDGLYLAIDNNPIARFSLTDQLRPDTASTVAALTDQGLDCRMLSGDPNPAALLLANALGLQHNLHGQTPEQKLAVLAQLRAQQQVVAMCGDGVNDAPVLAAADVSIALASGSELAQCDADLILLGQHLGPIVSGIQLAQRTHRTIKQNLFLSLAYNSLMVPLAVMGQVAPYVAAAGMSLSSLVVLGNSLRLLHDTRSNTHVPLAHAEKPQHQSG